MESFKSLNLISDDLEPLSQVEDWIYNHECPICFTIIKPTDDQQTGATECSECEHAFCKRCIGKLEECPNCRYAEDPVFQKKLRRSRKQELENLMFKCHNFEKCGQVLKHLEMIEHLQTCKDCAGCNKYKLKVQKQAKAIEKLKQQLEQALQDKGEIEDKYDQLIQEMGNSSINSLFESRKLKIVQQAESKSSKSKFIPPQKKQEKQELQVEHCMSILDQIYPSKDTIKPKKEVSKQLLQKEKPKAKEAKQPSLIGDDKLESLGESKEEDGDSFQSMEPQDESPQSRSLIDMIKDGFEEVKEKKRVNKKPEETNTQDQVVAEDEEEDKPKGKYSDLGPDMYKIQKCKKAKSSKDCPYKDLCRYLHDNEDGKKHMAEYMESQFAYFTWYYTKNDWEIPYNFRFDMCKIHKTNDKNGPSWNLYRDCIFAHYDEESDFYKNKYHNHQD